MIESAAPVTPVTIAPPRIARLAGARHWARGRGAFVVRSRRSSRSWSSSACWRRSSLRYDPTAIHARDGLQPPSPTYLLGTDNLGRDILSRIIYAARTSLLVALGSVVVAGAIGVPLGLIAGYAGGKIDSVIMRVLDAILAFPVILLGHPGRGHARHGDDQSHPHHRLRLHPLFHPAGARPTSWPSRSASSSRPAAPAAPAMATWSSA